MLNNFWKKKVREDLFHIDICIFPSYTNYVKILPEPVAFEWDKGNLDKNFKKHKVTNKEVEEVFESKPIFIFKDEKHSAKEKRQMIWGKTDRDRMLSIIFTVRENKVRVISARDMNKKERREYEKKVKTNTQV